MAFETGLFNPTSSQANDEFATHGAAPGGAVHVVVIDSTIEGYESLLDSVAPGADVILVGDGGLAELADALDGRSGVESIQILSHGAVGQFSLGGEVVDAASLADNAELWARIGATLSDDGDLLLFGCRIGDGGEGADFISQLAELTGADVAASDDLTGASGLGGDWDLEVQTGDIEAGEQLDLSMLESFGGLLATPTDETFDAEGFAFNSNTTSYVVNEWTFTADANVEFATFSTDELTMQLNSDGGAGDFLLAVNNNFNAVSDYTFGATDGSNFQLNSFDFQNILAGGDTTVTITVYDGVTEVGSGTFDLSTSSSSDGITYTFGGADSGNIADDAYYGVFSFSSTYQNVDSVSIGFSGSAGRGGFAIDDIDVSAAVASNARPSLMMRTILSRLRSPKMVARSRSLTAQVALA
ncbi:DUF4347 domain-containing protein [Kordiimonas gwangyangensis]|uniref:DUF4347 domain-containing protein n=1 Tax=Kordiimonas gwangyangensis TaxID=288022 RepID=UPI00047011AF|nr:DUF4347 domain-containing protein [Kordiimonas gwangyangensis]